MAAGAEARSAAALPPRRAAAPAAAAAASELHWGLPASRLYPRLSILASPHTGKSRAPGPAVAALPGAGRGWAGTSNRRAK